MTKSEKGHPCSFTILRGQVNYIEGLNDKEKMKFIGLIGNLKTHEMKKKARKEKAPQKKTTMAFKSTPSIFVKEEDDIKDVKICLSS